MNTNARRRVSLKRWSGAAFAVLTAACGGSTLEVPANHPGHPEARAGATPTTTTLGQLQTPSSAPAAADHSAHAEHVEHGQNPEHGEHGEHGGEGVYVCPMHPEIVSKEPTQCPICGMKLEPRKAAP